MHPLFLDLPCVIPPLRIVAATIVYRFALRGRWIKKLGIDTLVPVYGDGSFSFSRSVAMANFGAAAAMAVITAGCGVILLAWAMSSVMAIRQFFCLFTDDAEEPRSVVAVVLARYVVLVAVLSWKYEAIATPLFTLNRYVPDVLEHPGVSYSGAIFGALAAMLLFGFVMANTATWVCHPTWIEQRAWRLFGVRHLG